MEDFLNTAEDRKRFAAAEAVGLLKGLLMMGDLPLVHIRQAADIIAMYEKAARDVDAQLAQRMAA